MVCKMVEQMVVESACATVEMRGVERAVQRVVATDVP